MFAHPNLILIQQTTVYVAIVDDHPELRRQLGVFMRKKGFIVVIEAVHGRDRMELLKVCMSLPNVCILDVRSC